MKKERDKEQTRVTSKDSGTGTGTGTGTGDANKLTHPVISTMEPLTHEAYGGGMYGKDDDGGGGGDQVQHKKNPPASETQSADGPSETVAKMELKHKPPPSSGDRDTDITGQSYIQ